MLKKFEFLEKFYQKNNFFKTKALNNEAKKMILWYFMFGTFLSIGMKMD